METLGMVARSLRSESVFSWFTGREKKTLFSPKWVLNTSGTIRVVLLPGDEVAATSDEVTEIGPAADTEGGKIPLNLEEPPEGVLVIP